MSTVTITAAEVNEGESVVTVTRAESGAYHLTGTDVDVYVDGYDDAVKAAATIVTAVEEGRLLRAQAQEKVVTATATATATTKRAVK